MIWLFKNGEGKLFNEDEVKEKMAGGWVLKRDRTVADAPFDEGRDKKPRPQKNPDPGKKGKGVNMAIPGGQGTTLYKPEGN